MKTGKLKEPIEKTNKEQCAYFTQSLYGWNLYLSAHESQHLLSTNKAIYYGQAHKRVSGIYKRLFELEKC